MNLTVYYSLDALSERVSDYSNVYVLPTICFLGILTNALTILVAVDKKIRSSNIFKYIIVMAISDIVYMLSQSPLFIIRCGTLCPYGYSRLAKMYELYVFWFVGYSIISFQFLLDMSISIERLIIFFKVNANSRQFANMFYRRCLLFLVIGIILNIPGNILSMEVEPLGILQRNNNTNDDVLLYAKFVKPSYETPSLELMLTIVALLKEPLLVVLLCLLNILVMFKFKQHMKRKSLVLRSRSLSEILLFNLDIPN